ncbi:hypothetical protein MIR68_004962 [Amoeboaphelidium protococcarum]|nr:hypothetical protein MIR68_004962 [Amoeboaphelidium protococcarum]
MIVSKVCRFLFRFALLVSDILLHHQQLIGSYITYTTLLESIDAVTILHYQIQYQLGQDDERRLLHFIAMSIYMSVLLLLSKCHLLARFSLLYHHHLIMIFVAAVVTLWTLFPKCCSLRLFFYSSSEKQNYAFIALHIGTYQQARFTGIIEVQVMALNYHTMKRIFVEVGSDHLRRHWREIYGRLSRRQALFGQQYGGVWLGGLVVEDPSPTTGRAHSSRFVRFAVDRDTLQRIEVLRQQLPTFRRDEVTSLALPWMQDLDSQRQLSVSDLRDFLRDYERELVERYGACKIYEIYHSTLKGWLRRRFEYYMNRNR